jgi:phage N-6-adenine-methyltransferase
MSEAQGDGWGTPVALYSKLYTIFGPFHLDPCTTEDNILGTEKFYYLPKYDGLLEPWYGRVFMNPPYSKPRPWLEKAIEEVRKGNATSVLGLIKCDMSTSWWNDCIKHEPLAKLVYPWPKRIKYRGATQVANFPSAIVLWTKLEEL